jgi:hypothetical protein
VKVTVRDWKLASQAKPAQAAALSLSHDDKNAIKRIRTVSFFIWFFLMPVRDILGKRYSGIKNILSL